MYDGCAAQHLCIETTALICLKTRPTALPALLSLTGLAWVLVKNRGSSRGSLGLQKGCGSAAGPVHWVTLHPTESSVPSPKEEGEEPAMEMVSSTSHSSHVSFRQVSVGSEQGPWDPEVPSSPTACGGCRQALAWSRLPPLLGARPLVLSGGMCSCQKEQILLCRSSLLLKARSPAHLPGTGTPSTGPAFDVSHPSISRKCLPALCFCPGLVSGE